MTDFSNYYNVFTYRDQLIYFKIENFNSWRHRELAVKKDFYLKKYISVLDKNIFAEKPIFIPDILKTDKDVDSETDKTDTDDTPILNGNEMRLVPYESSDILDDWNKENWDGLMCRMYDAARQHKWCIPQLYSEPPYWRVFTYREIQEIVYDDFDIPIKAHAMWTKDLPLSHVYNYHDEWINLVDAHKDELDKDGEINSLGLFVNWGHDIDQRIEGNDLESVWSLSVYLRYILNDILCNSAKSSGFYHVKYGSGVSDAIKEDIVNAFELAGSSHMIGATGQTIEQIVAMFPKNPEFSVMAMDKVMKIFAGATGLPYLFFNGEKDVSGVFEENSSAMIQINNKKREIFSQLKFYILKLVEMRWGIKCEDVFANIPELEKEHYKEDVIDKKAVSGNGAAVESELKKMRLQK